MDLTTSAQLLATDNMVTGGGQVVHTLAEHGVTHYFSLVGGQMLSLYDEISKHDDLQLITVRNEVAAPLMASGFTAATGTPSVSLTTVGAGVVYEVAGLVNAWCSYLPVISLAPQVQSWKMKPHQENLQGLNQDEIYQPITRWNAIAYHHKRIPSLVSRAVREATSNVPGPVHLDIPVDILFEHGEAKAPYSGVKPFQGLALQPPGRDQIDAARTALARAKRPLLVIGQGMGRAGHFGQLGRLAAELGMPTLLSSYSSGILPGAPSFAGYLRALTEDEEGREHFNRADLLLVIGLDAEIKAALAKGRAGRKIIQSELDASVFDPTLGEVIAVQGDPLSFLQQISRIPQLTNTADDWRQQCCDVRDGIAQREKNQSTRFEEMWQKLTNQVGRESSIIIDGDELVARARRCSTDIDDTDVFLMDCDNVAGAGLPFALGVRAAKPSQHKVGLLTSKDALFRHINELLTARQFGLSLHIACQVSHRQLEQTMNALRGFDVAVAANNWPTNSPSGIQVCLLPGG